MIALAPWADRGRRGARLYRCTDHPELIVYTCNHEPFVYAMGGDGSRTDGDTFDRRGNGKIGVARSRDLIDWRLPGDMG